MSYVEKNVLTTKDEIVLNVKKSHWCLVKPWFWGIVGAILLLIPTIRAIIFTIRFHFTEYVVTKTKVIEKFGIIQIHTDEMDVSHVENITHNVSILGRILGYSNVTIQGTNRNNINFNGIRNGVEVRRIISDIVDQAKEAK